VLPVQAVLFDMIERFEVFMMAQRCRVEP